MILLTFFSGCQGSEREIVNQQYLESDAYHTFSDKAEQEIRRSRNRERDLFEQLKLIGDCQAPQTLVVPFTIDSLSVSAWALENKYNCFDDRAFTDRLYRLKAAAQTRFGKMNIWWVLRSKQTIYKDHELWLAIFKEKTLHSAELIGIFKENLREQITTTLNVSSVDGKLLIQSKQHRKIIYPFEQNNSVEKSYLIGPQGVID
ncbi:hypothetical protein SAMN06265218_10998 [Fodinibius sediminis]|uniref:Uncharacterized protein n=2 Tax=Fodinibius sediminis TaxID=1214077 RepID=A0A521DAP2_9BACT|nr:hypothetical protein SAMN06265218_10998 [Fodinibius sediminis]